MEWSSATATLKYVLEVSVTNIGSIIFPISSSPGPWLNKSSSTVHLRLSSETVVLHVLPTPGEWSTNIIYLGHKTHKPKPTVKHSDSLLAFSA